MNDSIIGKLCHARYKGHYLIGKIVRNEFKTGLCTLETRSLGTVKVKASRVKIIEPLD